MAFDGLVLQQLVKQLQDIVPAKINKIQQVSDSEILFTIRANNRNYKLMISAHSTYNRMHLSERSYTTPDTPNNFIMVLRKHISGAIIKDMKQVGLDRVVVFTLEARNELGDIHSMYMYVELMGKYANVILVNEDNKVVDALKRIPPFENNVRTIHPGATFIPVSAHENKQDPYHYKSIDLEESFTQQFHGFSPLLSTEVHYRIKNEENFDTILNEIANSKNLYIYEKDGKQYFHVIALTHLQVEGRICPLQEAMDTLYYEKEEKVRIKEQNGDLFKIVRQELKKHITKLKKLEKTLNEAYDLDDYRLYGDLLYAYAYQFSGKQKEVRVPSFESEEMVCIPLDEKWDVKTNAKKYYQKYQKAKTAQIEVAKQIEITKENIAYFEIVEAQLEQANFLDAMEIREELTNKGWIRKKQKYSSKKKKNIPNFITLEIEDTYIYIGKNNIQNDYITWKQGRKDDTWFHSKDIHGSHVVATSENPSENIIRIAAMFAAYYSKARHSSSVPINYCLLRQLRKPNKAALGFVTLTNYKTIYIDPNEEEIHSYLAMYERKA